MINYPNGKPIIKISDDQVSRSKKNLGMQLEKDIIKSCEYYRANGRALIYKRPTPIKVFRMDKTNRTHIIDAYFDEKSTTDFNGIYKSKYLDFECKETIKDTLTLAKIRPQQIDHLKMVRSLGGLAFFIVKFKTVDECYLLDAKFIVDDLTRKSFPRAYFSENGTLIQTCFHPRLDFLKAVDEVYFNEEKEEIY